MNIICEGIDRSGKTTLVNKLQDDFNLEIIHFTCPKPELKTNDKVLTPGIPVFNQFKDYIYEIMIPNIYKNKYTIFDRFLYSDIVYGPIYRPQPDELIVRKTEINFLELVMQSLGTMLIFCETDLSLNEKLIADENEGVLTDNKIITDVRTAYHNMLDPVTAFPKYNYNFNNEFYIDIKKWIEKINSENSKNTFYTLLKSLEGFGYYIGPIFNKPEQIISIPGQLTKPITYDEYLMFLRDNPEYIGNINIGFVRDKHPVSLFFKQLG